MDATFQRVILGQPEIAAIVFEFQFGLYEDVRPAFRACNELIEFDDRLSMYGWDDSFPKAFAPNAAWKDSKTFYATAYKLLQDERDDRLPLHLAIAEGCVQLAKRILGCRPDLASEDAIMLAFSKSSYDIVELLLDERESVPEPRQRNSLVRADAGTVLGNAKHLRDFLSIIVARADTRGVELLRRVYPRSINFRNDAIAIPSAPLAHAPSALGAFPWPQGILDHVAAKGFLPLVQLLHEGGGDCSTYAMDTAAYFGHVEVVRFLHEHRAEGCTVRAMDEAAANGHFEVVRFLHVNRTEGCTSYALDWAIRHGHLDVVRFLIENRSDGASPNILNHAAANGHLDVVEYLHSLGSFGCTVAAVDKAAARGHLDVVQFLLKHRSEGCTRDMVVKKALKRGHLRTAKYLLSLEYPFPTTEIQFNPESFREPEMVEVCQLLLGHSALSDFDGKMQMASSANNVPLVRFFHELCNACPHDDAMSMAINDQAWDVVDYLLANCTASISVNAFRTAMVSGSSDVLVRILQRQPELRHDAKLLPEALIARNNELAQYLLATGIGNPRKCLVKIAGHRVLLTESHLLLPYCMDPTDHLDNVIFLLDLLSLPRRRRKTTLQLITQELTSQGQKASKANQVAPSVAAHATALLQAGDVLDGTLTLAIRHLHATDTDVTAARLTRLVNLVVDDELKTQLSRLIDRKCK